MYKLSLHLWTPAFAGGPVPRTVDPFTPIRPPAVRGALRWWFRAAASAVLFPEDDSPASRERMLGLLRDAERELFGDTTMRSRVQVFPAHGGTVARMLPDRERWAGLNYLGYGLFEKAPSEAIITHRESLPPPAPALAKIDPIELRIGLRPVGPRDPITDAHRRLLGATTWLWLHFGGLGARTRRGWGSLGLNEDEHHLLSGMPALRADSIRSLVDGLPAGLDQATAIFRDDLGRIGISRSGGGTKPHPAIRSIEGIANVTVLPGEHPSPIAALDAAGRLFLGFRSTLARRRFGFAPLSDYHTVKASLQMNRPADRVERAAFGLPLPFYFRSLGGAKTRFVPDEKDADRLASPLLFRVHRIGSDAKARYVTAIVNLADRMDPMCGRRVLQKGPEGRVATTPDSTILTSFIDFAIKEASRSQGGQ